MKALECGWRLTILAGAIMISLAAPAQAQQCGDVDYNGDVTASDALVVLKYAVGQPVAMYCCACVTTTSTSTSTTTTTTSTTTTTVPAKPACGQAGTTPPSCNGFCTAGFPYELCIEYPPGSGACQCRPGESGGVCGVVAGPPTCLGTCPQFFICKQVGGICQCVF